MSRGRCRCPPPSTASLVRLTGVVMYEQDEMWQESRCFFEARKMLEKGLELEDSAKTAWDIKCVPGSRATADSLQIER